MKKSALILLCLAACLKVYAQFNTSENDPASFRWMSVKSDNYRVIYPYGTDSLALQYLRAFEYYRPKVANSIGMVSGQFLNRPSDIILHTRNSASNGAVYWTPNRMEMYTVAQWNRGSNIAWIKSLAIHEGRHASQMQLGYRRVFRPFRYITGQLIPGAVQVYPGSLVSEGDAVVAETALSNGGRGREINFLSRYYYSWDNGDYRKFRKWHYGSIYKPTPNNYALGYAVLSAARVLYDSPYFSAELFDYYGRRPYDPWPLEHNIRRISGKRFNEAFREMMDYHYGLWAADTLARGPFLPSTAVSRDNSVKTDYSYPLDLPDGRIIAVKEDIYHMPYLVSIGADGKEKRLKGVGSYRGRMNYSVHDGAIYWNELRRNPRWGQVVNTVIRRYDPRTNRVETLKNSGNLIYPQPVPDGNIVAVKYNDNGSYAISTLSASEGSERTLALCPEGMQAYALAVADSVIYAAGINDEGSGIWKLEKGEWSVELAAMPVVIEGLEARDGALYFQSDRNGSMELYRYDTADAGLYLLSNTKYGGLDLRETSEGDILFTQYDGLGTAVKRIAASDRRDSLVQWSDIHHYAVADALSAQEDTLVFEQRLRHPKQVDLGVQTAFSAPERYSKAANAFRIHSWAPLYVNPDAIEDISGGNIQNIVNLGATVWMQNSQSTLTGQLGYKAARDANGKWFHSGHIKLTWKGWYPVFELQADINDRNQRYIRQREIHFAEGGSGITQLVSYQSGKPFFSASLRTYIPWQWSASDLYYGLIPSVTLSFNNDLYLSRPNFLVNAGVRGYVMQNTPSGAVYPRWGIGAELRWMDPYAMAYSYAYVPGAAAGQGLRLTACYQTKTALQTSRMYVGGYASLVPRGMTEGNLSSTYRSGVKITADYAIPFYMGDWNISSLFYCKRGIITPHLDYSRVDAAGEGSPKASLFSAGASFQMDFASFFWLEMPVRIGVTTSYNFARFHGDSAVEFSPFYAGMLFNIDIP